MRVISGIAKGRRLLSPVGMDTRPTADRIKQSLFNMLAGDLDGAYFLDLFAGSGAIGIEALSRGVAKCVFVESNGDAMKVLRKNLDNTRFSEKSETYLTDAEAALKRIAKNNETFDIIFMDPPYESAFEMDRLTAVINKLGLLAENGYIIGEHSVRTDIGLFKNISPIKKKSYGKTTAVSFWRPA